MFFSAASCNLNRWTRFPLVAWLDPDDDPVDDPDGAAEVVAAVGGV